MTCARAGWRALSQIVGPVMMVAILYTWCSTNADQIVSFYFGTKFPVRGLPHSAAFYLSAIFVAGFPRPAVAALVGCKLGWSLAAEVRSI